MCTLFQMKLLSFAFLLYIQHSLNASTEKTCPIAPVLSVINSTGKYTIDKKSEATFVLAESEVKITFSCVANRPITVESESLMPPLLYNVVFAREVGNLFDKDSYCYRVTFTSDGNFRATGKYTCSIVAEPQLSSFMFLFTQNTGGTIFLNHGISTLIKGFPDDDGWITLPCVSTNLYSGPHISIRGAKAAKNLKLENGSFEYRLGLGFRIRAMHNECCAKSYRCSLIDDEYVYEQNEVSWTKIALYKNEAQSGKVFYRVNPSDYVLGFNPEIETKLEILLNDSITVTCESNFAVKVEVNETNLLSAGHLVFEAKLSSNGSSFYKHKATLQLTTLQVGLLTVICRAMHNQAEVHRWRITTVLKKVYPTYGVEVGVQNYKIICGSATGHTPSVSMIQCTDFMNCAIAKKFSRRILQANQQDFPFNVVPGHSGCNTGSRYSKGSACASVPYSANLLGSRLSPGTFISRGLVMCSEALNDGIYLVYTRSFMIGFNIIVLEPQASQGKGVLLSEGIGVLLMNEIKPLLYVDEEVFVTCEALYGVYTMGIQISLNLQNGTKLNSVNGLTSTEKLENQVIIFEAKFTIHDPQITQILCFAPFWSSNKWRIISKNVSVTVGVAPHILNSTTTETLDFGIGDIELTLICEFDGDPKPTANWKMESDVLSQNSSRVKSINTTASTSVLELESIVEAHAGLYTCEASSFKGIALKHFQINVVRAGGSSYEFKLLWRRITFTSIPKLYSPVSKRSEVTLCKNMTPSKSNWVTMTENQREIIYDCFARSCYVEMSTSEGFTIYNLGLFIGIPVGITLIIVLIYVFLQNRTEVYIILNLRANGLSVDEINVFYKGCLPENGVASSKQHFKEQLFNEMPYNSSFELLSRNFEIERATILGEGQFGTVYKGQLKIEDVVETVAFKTCKSASDTKHLKCLLSEIKLMIYIGHHPYIIRFHGAYTRQLKFGIAHFALEFCAKGSLENFLRNANQEKGSEGYKNVADRPNPKNVVCMLCDWSFQIASGMEYLAGKKIIHADLAARNILVAGDNSVRITDFGLSRRLENYANYSKMGTDDLLPWRWMALESLENLKFSTQSDIWSFGVTIWEIYSMGKIPYHNRSWTKSFADELRNGERLPHPEFASNEIYEKLLQCWRVEEELRPTFRDLSQFFKQISYEKQNITYVQHIST